MYVLAEATLLFSVSALGDPSNIEGRIAGTILDERLIPYDNNIGKRRVR